MDSHKVLRLTAGIVSAFSGHNHIKAESLPALIESVFQTLATVETVEPEAAPPQPIVPVKQSVRQDHVTCLECGKKFRSLRRHLMADHGLTPDGYRARFGLPPSYPMVAPAYAAQRSAMAKQIGLGRKRIVEPEPEPEAPPPPPPAPVATVKPAAAGRRRATEAQRPAEPIAEPPSREMPEERAPSASAASSSAPSSSAPSSSAPSSSTGSLSAASVFANFPRAEQGRSADAETSDEEPTAAAKAPKRKPFARQPARRMRAPGRDS